MRVRIVVPVLILGLLAGGCAGVGDDTEVAGDRPAAAARPTPAADPTPEPEPTPSPTPSPSPTAQAAPDATTTYASPDELATALVAAERAIRDPELPAALVPGWAWAQQAAYRQLADRPEWDEAVRATVPEELHATLDANVRAGRALRALTKPREELPDWRIVAPPAAEELLASYRTAAEEFGIDWSYLAAIHLTETRMGRIRGVSTAGARGPMQFMPATWDAYGEGDIEDPTDAIRAAARYLADHGAPEDMRSALWAYNHSDLYVDAVAAYAEVMRADPLAYRGYHGWQVYYRLTTGDVVLEEGWTKP